MELLIAFFKMEMFLSPLPMMYIYRSIYVLQEYILMLVTSTIETTFRLLHVSY